MPKSLQSDAARLQLSGISKFFPGVKAWKTLPLTLRPGEVHALCGENGAGKSTLMNILAGNLRPDAGEIRLNGQPVQIAGPGHAPGWALPSCTSSSAWWIRCRWPKTSLPTPSPATAGA
jgi:ABC-type uncharacterized transport system ATPase subunit